MPVTVRRLGPGDGAVARATFSAIAEGFEDTWTPLGDAYLVAALARDDLLILAALDGDAVLGGLTAFVLPMMRAEEREVFIYDLAVVPARQREGVGRALLTAVRTLAAELGAANTFVPADVEDTHALRFYASQGGEAADVTMFTFDAAPPPDA